jgi:cysteine desulfurase
MENIYLDHASAMPVDPRILKFSNKYLTEAFGNPSSLYNLGQDTKEAIEESRKKIAKFINAESKKTIIFTGSATESNNLAIRGTAYRNLKYGKEILSSAIEHISVINPMKELQKNGWTYNIIPVDENGIIDITTLKKKVNSKSIISSVMYANNEIGTIQPISEISEIIHENGQYLHVDATAAAGRIPIDVQTDGIDLLSLSSNDLYGPCGAGALYVKPGINIQSVILGGGQERGLRSGTENVFAIVGMGKAAEIAEKEMKDESIRLIKIRDKLIEEISKIDKANLTGHPKKRLPHHVSFIFKNIEGESILLNMDMYGIQVATGSACSSKTLEASHVLLSIGLKHEEAHGSMVITLGRSNKLSQVPRIVKAVKETVKRLRMLSPLSK